MKDPIPPREEYILNENLFKKFNKFSKIYRSAPQMGAGKILKSALNLPMTSAVPLSLSHGVDFGHCFQPLDINLIEPIHWSYNHNIHHEALHLKPSVCLPHPWLLSQERQRTPPKNKVLAISPPPGKENDSNLLKKIKEIHDPLNVDILLKYRGSIKGSIDFFQRNGSQTVSAGEGDENFYDRLLALLSSYKRVVACNFSSAIIFAAAIGKPIDFIEDYSYEYYDVENIYDFVNYNSSAARNFVLDFLKSSDQRRTELARKILGSDFLDTPENMRQKYISALMSAEYPFHYKENFQPLRRALINAGNILSRPGLARLGTGFYGFSRSRRKILKIKINEFSIWKNGPSEKNLSFSLEKFIPGVTVPATAVAKYEEFTRQQ